MSVSKQEIIAFLEKRYFGDVQARGLWLWSGGNAKDVPYLKEPEKRWNLLWTIAEKEDAHNAPQNLIHEALLDSPGDKFLIDCLVSFSATTSASIKNDARLLIEILKHWGEEFEFDPVLASLLVFHDCTVRDGLTVLIPNLNEKIEQKLLDKWEPWFQKIKKEKLTGSIKGIFSLLDFMLDPLMKNSPRIDSEKFHINATKAKAYLEKVLKELEDVSEEDNTEILQANIEELTKVKPEEKARLENLLKEFAPLIGTFVEINSNTLKPESLTAFTGIKKIFELSKTISSEKRWPLVHNSAEICFKSIWATKAKKTEDEATENS